MELTKAHCIEVLYAFVCANLPIPIPQLGYGEDMIHPSLDMTTTCNEKAMAITLAENKRFMNKGRCVCMMVLLCIICIYNRLVDSGPLIELVSSLSSLLLQVEVSNIVRMLLCEN